MKLPCLLILLAMIFCSHSAEADSPAQITLLSGDILRGQFTETRHMKGFDGPVVLTGRFTVAPGYGLIWDVQKPYAITTVITPHGLVQFVGQSKITDLSANKLPFLLHLYDALSGALAGDWQALEKDFTITRKETAHLWQMDLNPRQVDAVTMPFHVITIAGSQFAQTVHMVKNDEDRDDIVFSGQAVHHVAPLPLELVLFGASSP